MSDLYINQGQNFKNSLFEDNKANFISAAYVCGFLVVIDLMHASRQTKICNLHDVIFCDKNVPCC